MEKIYILDIFCHFKFCHHRRNHFSSSFCLFYSVIVLIMDYGRVATIEEIPSTNLLSFYSVIVLILFFYLVAVKENNWARSFQTLKGAYATKGNQWVSYNDVQFVKEKADYVIKNKYGGVAVFTMDMDDFNNSCCQVRFIEIKWLYINLLRRH